MTSHYVVTSTRQLSSVNVMEAIESELYTLLQIILLHTNGTITSEPVVYSYVYIT